MNKPRLVALNAVVAALYVAVALLTPATAFLNVRVSTALYVLAAWNPALIPGLALGNALAGVQQGPLDVALGLLVGIATPTACYLLGKRWAWVAVAVVPTLVVPLWLGYMFNVPYVAVVPALAVGQAISAGVAWLLSRSQVMKHIVEVK
jgi:uncharacterized membrane protein